MGKTLKANLQRAKQQKQDEFYTQMSDIENELRHYRDQFRGKIVLCNCDDPYESNFFKYFANNFNYIGLKKLIATSYTTSPIAGSQLPLWEIKGLTGRDDQPFVIEITEVPDANGDGAVDLGDITYLLRNEKNTATPLQGNGDFRSPECVEFLKQADIVCTNPPFSLFREYVALLMEHKKQFLIIGSKNAITYQEVFALIKANRIWLGHGFAGGNAYFKTPHGKDDYAAGVYNPETGLVKFRNVGWFTNLDTTKRHDTIEMYRQYHPNLYPHYDNYNVIEVSRYIDIPYDYEGPMGVPITFLDRYNPDQFEILGWTRGRNEFEVWPTKKYQNARQIKPDGSESSGGKVNTGPTLLIAEKPANETVYVADGVDGFLKQTYMRVIIRNRHPQGGPE